MRNFPERDASSTNEGEKLHRKSDGVDDNRLDGEIQR